MTIHYTTSFVSLLSSNGASEFVRHAKAAGVFAYPTSTVYGLGTVVDEDAIRRLTALKSRPDAKRFLVVSGQSATFDRLEWTDPARRLARRFWPGPLTLILRDPEGIFPPSLRGVGGGVAVRHTAHAGVRALEWALGSPLTSTSANPPGQPPARDAVEARAVLEALGADPPWVVDGGRLEPSPSSTLVDCTATSPRVLREGTFTLQEIERALSEESADRDIGTPEPFSMLFVCTGNTCRSPLAEAIARRQVEALGWAVSLGSAGVFAAPGAAASHESVAVAARHGLSLERHEARQLDESLVSAADVILTMGSGHLEAALTLGAGGKVAMLSAFADGSDDPFAGADVIDPIGSGLDVYEATYENLVGLIDRALERLAPVLAPRPDGLE